MSSPHENAADDDEHRHNAVLAQFIVSLSKRVTLMNRRHAENLITRQHSTAPDESVPKVATTFHRCRAFQDR